MRWDWNCFIEKPFLKNSCQILLVFYNSWKFIIMQWYLISFDKVIVKMNWQYLRILNWLIIFFRQTLMINIFLGLICIICRTIWNSSVARSTSMPRSTSTSWSLLMWAWWLFFSSCFWRCLLNILINWLNLYSSGRIYLRI